jgi:cysteinyl-tRNA synthetase
MEFRLCDTLTNRVKPLEPQEPGHLKFYSCGPTDYSYPHIGNFRSADTIHLASSSQAKVELFITNDARLRNCVIPNVPFVAGIDGAVS